MGTASTIGPFRGRMLSPISTEPLQMSIFSGTGQTIVKRSTDGNRGPCSRPAVGVGGMVVAAGGWPGRIRRSFSFVTMPHAPVVVAVNVVTGVPSRPTPRQRKTRR